jgi:predicted AAA+ superfamily ATPase
VFENQSNLIETFRQDFSKYAPYTDKRSLNHALSMVAKNTGKQIKYTQLSDEFTGPTNKKAFELLQLAQLIHKVRMTSPASLPLAASASESRFKAILTDMGLLQALNDFPANVEFRKNDLLAMYNGNLAEQFAGQEFISGGMDNLYYWSREARSSSAEVDYLIVKNNKIYPVEVKSGAAGKLRSMHLLLQNFPQIDQGYVLSTAPFGQLPAQKLTFLPLYYAYGLVRIADQR